ncbi:hypothetical protein IE978_21260 [Klebsiella pneumoniae]|uniref:Uncharacterized protein n=1 Tax=Klebsiella pneumoniae TaxID=573 RepID=A0A927DA61_KLEPN|nr:hypothetical protein [Klebsiella pneumoniae]MBD3722791.1 hypothetical protein [Klebsiella pneumoniae]
MTNTPARNTISASGKGNHSQPVDEETALFLGDRTVSRGRVAARRDGATDGQRQGAGI